MDNLGVPDCKRLFKVKAEPFFKVKTHLDGWIFWREAEAGYVIVKAAFQEDHVANILLKIGATEITTENEK